MPPDSRQVDVPQKHGGRNPAPTPGTTRWELAAAAGAGAGDVKLSEPKLCPDKEELRRIIDLIPQTIVVLNPDGKAIYANRVALEYTGLSLDEVCADNFRDRVFHPEDAGRGTMVMNGCCSGATKVHEYCSAISYSAKLLGLSQSQIGATFEQDGRHLHDTLIVPDFRTTKRGKVGHTPAATQCFDE